MNKVKYFHFNSRDEFYRIEFSKIAYFEADGNYTNVVLCNGLKGMMCISLMQMQKELTERLKEQASMFARVCKRHIINLNYVYRIEVLHQRLTLSDGERFAFPLAISKDALKALRELYLNQLKTLQRTHEKQKTEI